MKRVSLPKGRSLSQIAYGVWRTSSAKPASADGPANLVRAL